MTDPAKPPVNHWKTLDKDLARFNQLEAATAAIGRQMVATGIAFVFVPICAPAAFVLAGQQSGLLGTAVVSGLVVAVDTTLSMRPVIRCQSEGMGNRRKSLKKLFGVPLILSAALLSFAHGANDVANAVGPLAAIVHAVQDHGTAAKVEIPVWVMVIGAFGISFGLLLFVPKLIRMVLQEITKLNPMRALFVALSAAITVIIASWLGLPVSSTHIAVGGVFGVGFCREWHAERRARALNL